MDGTQRPTKIADSLSPLNQSVSEKIRERNAAPISSISATVNFLIMIVRLKYYLNFSNFKQFPQQRFLVYVHLFHFKYFSQFFQ